MSAPAPATKRHRGGQAAAPSASTAAFDTPPQAAAAASLPLSVVAPPCARAMRRRRPSFEANASVPSGPRSPAATRRRLAGDRDATRDGKCSSPRPLQ